MVALAPRKVLAFVALMATAALLPGPAAAFSLFGVTVFGDQAQKDAEAVIADPRPYSVDFAVSGGAADLTTALEGASSLWGGRDKPASGVAGLLAVARADYGRLVNALYAQGYYGGTVSILVNGQQAAKLAPDADLGDPIKVLIRIDPGPLFHFGTLKIVRPAPTSATAPIPALADMGFAKGAVAKSGAVRRVAQAELLGWRRAGHAKVALADQAVVADHNTNRLDVTLTFDPGARAAIGAISVKGAKAVDPEFIVHASGLQPGAAYSPQLLDTAQARLVALGVFDVVRLVEADTIGPDGRLPITIVVGERKPRRIGAGANYSTVDGLGLQTFWLHRNLFGQAERLRLDAKLSGIAFPIRSADFDYYFGGTFTKPAILSPDTDLTASLIAQRAVLTNYTEKSLAAHLGLDQTFGPHLTVSGGIFAKAANFYDDVYGERDFTLLGLESTATYDTRDSTTDPTSGIFATLGATPFYEAAYGNGALKLEGEARTYFGFGKEDRFVLAGRLKVGALLGPSIAETPPDQLFFAGGGGSVRGYAYRSIGVVGSGGDETGGKFLTEASIEARAKLTDTIGLVGFVDAGYVTADKFVGLADGTKIGVGVGLRYYTGLGPIRFDLGVPLNKRAGDPSYAVYIGIGQAF